LIQRVGVCRDYAHLAIALCRALCIPARYISGYAVALQPPDFHGFFEAYLGARWYLFDATRMAPVEGFVRIGTGRDAADASFATIIGEAALTYMAVWAEQTAPNQIFNQSVLQSAVSTTN
jgi:transglutaminase-like putative cysteine protease